MLLNLSRQNSSRIIIDSALFYCPKIVEIGIRENNSDVQALGYAWLGFYFGSKGDDAEGLNLLLKSLKLAEINDDKKVLQVVYMMISFCYTDYRGVENAKRALALAKESDDVKAVVASLDALGTCYYRTGQYDSALSIMQQAYALHRKLATSDSKSVVRIHNVMFPYRLGNIHLKLSDPILAESYYKISKKAADEINNDHAYRFAYRGLMTYYTETGNIDSAFYYAQKLVNISGNDMYWTIDAFKVIVEFYKKRHDFETSLKYNEMYIAAKDSFNSQAKAQDIERLSLTENLRQRELQQDEQRRLQERKRDLQYALIGVVLSCMIIVFFLLSHTIVVKSVLVKLFGVMALLLLFEFVNLLAHPFISNFTHHSPIWMFLIMVCIAALLVPAHHRLEKWITHKMVEKNKRIRLAAAKKTISALES
jgi:tetratricopeptide (TPR) repeat protein